MVQPDGTVATNSSSSAGSYIRSSSNDGLESWPVAGSPDMPYMPSSTPVQPLGEAPPMGTARASRGGGGGGGVGSLAKRVGVSAEESAPGLLPASAVGGGRGGTIGDFLPPGQVHDGTPNGAGKSFKELPADMMNFSSPPSGNEYNSFAASAAAYPPNWEEAAETVALATASPYGGSASSVGLYILAKTQLPFGRPHRDPCGKSEPHPYQASFSGQASCLVGV